VFLHSSSAARRWTRGAARDRQGRALIADEYDDRIVKKYGGQTMRDLLEEAAVERILDHDPRPSVSDPGELDMIRARSKTSSSRRQHARS